MHQRFFLKCAIWSIEMEIKCVKVLFVEEWAVTLELGI